MNDGHNVRESVAILACVFALSLSVLYTPAVLSAFPNVAAVIAGTVTELTNGVRTEEGVEVLKTDDVLTRIAQARADDMATRGYFSHVSPEGYEPWHWYDQGDYAFTYAGENLALDYTESPDVVRAWLQSPTHRANIVGSQFTRTGVGVASGIYKGKETTFIVQEFATPAPAKRAESVRRSLMYESGTESVATVSDVELLAATSSASSSPVLSKEAESKILGASARAIKSTPAMPWWFPYFEMLGL